ncbi:hypothetical protein [Streptomyces flavidovirens]|uniref:hypothetical protein n=1 Tax=Streptomyces flavidovirens TaxID=67298 RepID=UPI0036BF8FDF
MTTTGPGRAFESLSFGNFDPEWAEQRAEDGEIIDTETAHAIVADLAALVGNARGQDRGVYCWVA